MKWTGSIWGITSVAQPEPQTGDGSSEAYTWIAHANLVSVSEMVTIGHARRCVQLSRPFTYHGRESHSGLPDNATQTGPCGVHQMTSPEDLSGAPVGGEYEEDEVVILLATRATFNRVEGIATSWWVRAVPTSSGDDSSDSS
jgi:hypothetical protein